MTQTNELANNQNENQEQEAKRQRNKKILLVTLVVIFVILLALIAVEIAYIADFYIYKDSGNDGLLWTVAQRQTGLFGNFNN
ncbi:hypothetical protein [Mycoplasma buteonis]|uniref:hypothetical protein n=1 Tax=Mycoplasma buteonis TaxID=171280 RepID=UPI00055DF788|nr:hypothetical protein [Mycoplasma buteonis]